MSWTRTAPTDVVGWSDDVSGDWVNMYNQGKYGFAYHSIGAITRLKDNSICVRIQMYSKQIMGWGAGNGVAYRAWIEIDGIRYDGEYGSYTYTYGQVVDTWYYIIPSNYTGKTISAGMTSSRNGGANSPITLSIPSSLGVRAYMKIGETWKMATPWVNIGGTWKQVIPHINNAGTWK